jgi:site-specific recombinase XerD
VSGCESSSSLQPRCMLMTPAMTFPTERLSGSVLAARIRPSQIEIEDVDAPLVLAFLEYVERKRGNTARTRNVRLAAIKAFFRYLEHRHVAYLDQSRQIHAIPTKKIDEGLIDYLTRDELLAVLNAPDNRTRSGLRDRAMLHLAFAAGLRVSELISIRVDDLDKRKLDTIHVIGKGRRERVLPLWAETKDVLRSWLAVRPPSLNPELFLNTNGKAMSRFGFAYVVSKHVKAAARQQLSLLKKRISPHALRHYVGAIDAEGWRLVALLRLASLIPGTATNYILGVTRVGLWTYTAATFIGLLPQIALFVYLGAAGRVALDDPSRSPLRIALIAISLIFTAWAALVIARRTKAALAERFSVA